MFVIYYNYNERLSIRIEDSVKCLSRFFYLSFGEKICISEIEIACNNKPCIINQVTYGLSGFKFILQKIRKKIFLIKSSPIFL